MIKLISKKKRQERKIEEFEELSRKRHVLIKRYANGDATAVDFKELNYMSEIEFDDIDLLIVVKSHYWIDSLSIIGVVFKDYNRKPAMFVDVNNLNMDNWLEHEELDNALFCDKILSKKRYDLNYQMYHDLHLSGTSSFGKMAEELQWEFKYEINKLDK